MADALPRERWILSAAVLFVVLGGLFPNAIVVRRAVEAGALEQAMHPPAAGDRVVFASKGRQNTGGLAYIFEPDPVIRFKLQPSRFGGGTGAVVPPIQWTVPKSQEVMIEADHGIGFVPTSPGLMANQQPWGRVPNQFVVDPDTATVTFLNMENFSLDLSAARSPAELAALGIDTGGRPAGRRACWCSISN